jgi:hypothetical protein
MDLAHGWPISIWLYVCQINRFMNSVAPNFRVQCSVIKAFVEPKHNYETLIHDSEVYARGAYRLLNENNVKTSCRNYFVCTNEDLLLQIREHLKVMFEP